MKKKLTYKQLEQRVNALEVELAELKHAEERIKTYKLMVESAHDAIFFKDLTSRYVIANAKALRVFGIRS
jgi:PAS domain-containing protein